MSMKNYVCLGLFILPLLGMIAILFNSHSPVGSTIIDPDGNIRSSLNVNSETNSSLLAKGDKQDNNISSMNESEWISRKVNKLSSRYKLERNFASCEVSKNVWATIKNWEVIAPLAQISRRDFLEIVFNTHCIDFSKADISNIAFDDIGANDIKTKQIVKTAMEFKLTRGYDEAGKKLFKASKKISKIEALAMLMTLSWIKLEETIAKNNFWDLENNWKTPIADKAYRLWLTPIDTQKNLFYPDYIMKKWDAYDIISKISKYY